MIMPEFIRKDEWPGYTPDGSVLDYRCWAWLKQKMYSNGKPSGLAELINPIIELWKSLTHQTIQQWLSNSDQGSRKSLSRRKANSTLF
jgi:hypothetical protein